ncbi:Hypothetical predicted protein [Olea europaea subsp. europaea]|uniref:Uncharacterized protein n=1 Tax=Olea europaea subsp. europaea TaxID=158383 RepID=A0A8S0UFU6_OLEEU|nr:Hypothetical predicted protein [Olea europaea subsp. europaea]
MVSFLDNFAPPDRTLGSCRNYVTACVLCLGQSIDTPRGFVPTHALRPALLCLTTVSIWDNFAPTDRTLGSCEHYVATCVLCLGQLNDTSCGFVPTHALRPASSCLTTISISNNFAPPDRTLGSCRNHVAVCLLCLGQSRRPDAIMSTIGCGRYSVLRIFKGRWGRTGHHETCGALPAARPYLRLSRFQGGQAVKQKS